MKKYKIQTGDWKITDNERKAINNVLDSGRISEGKYCEKFENKYAKFIGTKYCSVTNSGTSSLIVGMRAMNNLYKNNGEIATTPFTYIATINSMLLTDNEPSFIDIEPETMGMCPEALKIRLEENPDIKAIAPVHIMGIPCKIDKIKKIANKYKIPVIEDNCQSYGSKYKGKMLGSYGLFSTSSFFIAHNLQVSEMGAINTNNRDMRRVIDKLKSNGRTSKYDTNKEYFFKNKVYKDKNDLHQRYFHDMISGNYRAQEFSASLGYEQLKEIKTLIKKRNDNVKYLNENLEEVSDVLKLPKYDKDIAYLGYPIIINKPEVISRASIRDKVEKAGIETRPMYGNLPIDMPSLKDFKKDCENKMPNADHIGRNAWYIGCHQYLKREDLDYIIKTIKKIIVKG